MAARVPYVERDQLDTQGQKIYDTIRRDRNAQEVGMQFKALLHRPQAASYLTSLGSELRFHSTMPEDLKEFAIIVAAREWNSAIEWRGHSKAAARAGISDASIEAVRTMKNPTGLTEKEQIITRFVHQLLRDKTVTDEVFVSAQELLGTEGVVDLTLTCGYYTALALAQLALKPEMDAGGPSTLGNEQF